MVSSHFLAEEQAGFRKERSTVQQTLTLRLIAETAIWKGQCIYNCCINFTKAFDTVGHHLTWAVLHSYGVDDKLVRVKKQAYLQ